MMYRYLCILLMALLGLFLAYPAWPASVSLDQAMPDALLFVKWDNGKTDCIRFETAPGVLFKTPPANSGETLQHYVHRSWKYSPPTPAEKTRCDVMAAKYTISWTVAPLRRKGKVYPRPVYRLSGFPGTRVKIGAIKAGTMCSVFVAPYSKRIKALTWREVPFAAGMGVSVCRK